MTTTTTTHPTGLLLLACAVCVVLVVPATSGLPITSKPLDDNPDHLTWEAGWLGGRSKKITPKSIFIAPFLNSYNTSGCPPDYKVDYNGKCIQVLSINTADILVTKLQSLFSQHNGDGGAGAGGGGSAGMGEDDYDYDYDSTGPFQVNLPLSLDAPPEPAQSPKQTLYQDIPGPSFYDSAMVDVATVEQDNAKITTVAVDKPFPASTTTSTTTTAASSGVVGGAGNGRDTTTTASSSDQSAAETHDISFLAFESLPNGTLAGQIELDGNNRTVVQSILVSSTTTERPGSGGSSSRTTEQPATGSTELAGSSGAPTDRAGEAAAGTDATVASSMSSTDQMSTTTEQQRESTITPTEQELTTFPTDGTTADTSVAGAVATTTTELVDDNRDPSVDEFGLELVDELLLMDNNRSMPMMSLMSSSTPEGASTTDVSEMDLDTLPTSETQPTDELPTVANSSPRVDEWSTPAELSTTTDRVLVHSIPPPTQAPPVQIITPLRNSWLEYGKTRFGGAPLVPASQHHLGQQDRTTRATPETSTVPYDRTMTTTTVRNETVPVEPQNRFVQHQPPATEPPERLLVRPLPPTTTTRTTTTRTTTTMTASGPHANYLDQLRKINEIVAEKRRQQQQQEQQLNGGTMGADASTVAGSRIRFPSREEEQLTGAASSNQYQQLSAPAAGGGVRFPGTATNRLTPGAGSNQLPDIFPKKPSGDTTTQRPAFWWLPSGWEVDQTGNKPMLLRFWSRMPLVRDSSQQPAGAATTDENDLNGGSNRWRSATGYQQTGGSSSSSNSLSAARSSSSSSSSHPVVSARGNSKSPSENFYKEVSAQEVYKVMNARQLQHSQGRKR